MIHKSLKNLPELFPQNCRYEIKADLMAWGSSFDRFRKAKLPRSSPTAYADRKPSYLLGSKKDIAEGRGPGDRRVCGPVQSGFAFSPARHCWAERPRFPFYDDDFRLWRMGSESRRSFCHGGIRRSFLDLEIFYRFRKCNSFMPP